MLQTIIRPNEYQDSVALMLLSRRLTDLPGVTAVSVMMGTAANKDILRETGFGSPELDSAHGGDLVLAVDADDADAAAAVQERATELLAEQSTAASASGRVRVRSLARALDKQPASNLALVSVPGEHAASVSHELLEAGLSVMIFSDNVGLADEVALKERAAELGLLVMGPDCGTSVLSGAPLAFANVSRPGSIGIVGAAGTGIQEVASQIDRRGGGLTHAIGLGGRDLSTEVGASSCLRAMALLEADPATEVIVVVSKPPAPEVRARVEAYAATLTTPVVALFVGAPAAEDAPGAHVRHVATMEDAARVATELAGGASAASAAAPDASAGVPADLPAAPADGGIKALYTGGTLAAEAAALMRAEMGLGGDPASHPDGVVLTDGPHEVLDLGDDVYTRGRPHPMIDPSSRAERIAATLADPACAVLLLDVVLGHGSSEDPAGALTQPLREGLAAAAKDGRTPLVVASVCGTSLDPQGLAGQVATLREAGVVVADSNAAAVRTAIAALRATAGTTEPAASTAEPASAPEPAAAEAGVPAAVVTAGEGATSLLTAAPKVVNVGLASFADTLAEAGVDVVQWDWSPLAGGDPRLARLVTALMSR